MKIENIKRVELIGFEAQKISDVIEMVGKIADEFDWTREEVFGRLLDHYYRNEGEVATEIDF